MSWKDSLKKYRTNVSGSGMIPLDNVLKDHEELTLKIVGIRGAVGRIRDNTKNYINDEEKLRKETMEIKDQLDMIQKLIDDMNKSYSFESDYDWEKTMEDLT